MASRARQPHFAAWRDQLAKMRPEQAIAASQQQAAQHAISSHLEARWAARRRLQLLLQDGSGLQNLGGVAPRPRPLPRQHLWVQGAAGAVGAGWGKACMG